MILTPQDIEAIADAVVVRLRNSPVSDTMLNLQEATAYVHKRSTRSFREWAVRYGVKWVVRGRYSRQQLDKGSDRERRGEIRG
ncbi:MAG TPA: hypothetical protein PLN52_08425 [Opitutaceae bacterium]|nr:hypothetical protein [Opitutaceae bacterium]